MNPGLKCWNADRSMKFQIVIPVTNQWPFTEACLKSIQSKHEYGITIVDGGSTDSTLPFLDKDWPHIKVIHLPFESVSKAWNTGIRDAFEDPDMVAAYVLNNDTVLHPDTINNLVDYWLAHPESGFLQSLDVEKNPPEHFPTTCRKCSHANLVEMTDKFAGFYAFFITREVFEKLGGFNEDYIMGYGEDMEADLKMKELGITPVGLYTSPLFHWNGVTTNKTQKHYEFDHNIRLFNDKGRGKYFMRVVGQIRPKGKGRDSQVFFVPTLTKSHKPKKKILWLSHSPLIYNGFGKVTDYITQHLGKEHEVMIYCSNAPGLPFQYENVKLYMASHFTTELGGFKELMKRFAPDVLVTLQPWHGLWPYAEAMLEMQHKCFWINYLSPPLHTGTPIPSYFNLTHPVAQNPRDQAVLQAAGYNCDFIPHGVNTDVFYPLAHPEDWPFGFLYIGRNESRKGIDRLFHAFSIVQKKHPNIRLGLQTPPVSQTPEDHGFNIQDLVRKYEIGNALVMHAETQNARRESEIIQREIINKYDCFVTATQIESFGLPIIESFACAKPVVCPDWDAPGWLAEGRGYAAKIETTFDHSTGNSMALVDVKDLSNGMLRMIEDQVYYKQCAMNALKFALSHSWSEVCEQWTSLISSV